MQENLTQTLVARALLQKQAAAVVSADLDP